MVIPACSSGVFLMGPLTTTIRLMTPRKNETNKFAPWHTYEGSTITCIVPPRVAFVSHPQPLLRESIQIPPAHKTKRSLKRRDPQVVWCHDILHPRMGKILFAKVTRWVSICYCAISKYDIKYMLVYRIATYLHGSMTILILGHDLHLHYSSASQRKMVVDLALNQSQPLETNI